MVIDRRTVILGVATVAAIRTAEGVPPIKWKPRSIRQLNVSWASADSFSGAANPKKLAQWYQLHLGIDPVPTDYSHSAWQQAAGPTAFSPFPMDTDYLGSRQQAWMVNFECEV